MKPELYYYDGAVEYDGHTISFRTIEFAPFLGTTALSRAGGEAAHCEMFLDLQRVLLGKTPSYRRRRQQAVLALSSPRCGAEPDTRRLTGGSPQMVYDVAKVAKIIARVNLAHYCQVKEGLETFAIDLESLLQIWDA